MIKTIQDMEEYLKTFNKKFLRFKSRAPIYFTFQATPFAVSLYHDSEFSEESLDYSLQLIMKFLLKTSFLT